MSEFTPYVEMEAEVLLRLGPSAPQVIGTQQVSVPVSVTVSEDGSETASTDGRLAHAIADVLQNAANEIRANPGDYV